MSVEENDSRDVSTRQDTTSELSFDNLARGLASGAFSRRQAMRLLGGAVVGSALALIPGVARAAPNGPQCKPLHDKCTTNVQCCSRFCDKNGKQCSCPEGTEIACNNRCVPTCDDPTDPCKVSLCDPTTGKCVVANAPDGTPCEDGNPCTLVDTCKSGQCQAGPVKTCGPSGNPCAVLVCDKTTGVCEPQPGNRGAVCRPSAGPCDVAETCTGESVLCPTDQFEPATKVCRPSAGPCDVADTCTGASADCPTDQLRASGVACGPTPTQCETRATCTGLTATCPPNPITVGGSCNDNDPCTVNDQCAPTGTCAGTPRICPTGQICVSGTCQCPAGRCGAGCLGTTCGTATSPTCCTGSQICCAPGTNQAGKCKNNCN